MKKINKEDEEIYLKVTSDLKSGKYDNWEFKSGGVYLYFLDKKIYSLIEYNFSDKDGYIPLKRAVEENACDEINWESPGIPLHVKRFHDKIKHLKRRYDWEHPWNRIVFYEKGKPEIAGNNVRRDRVTKHTKDAKNLPLVRHKLQIKILTKYVKYWESEINKGERWYVTTDLKKYVERQREFLLIYQGIIRVSPNDPYWALMLQLHPIRTDSAIPISKKTKEMRKVFEHLFDGKGKDTTKPEIKEPGEGEAGKKIFSTNPGFNRLNKPYNQLLIIMRSVVKDIDANDNDGPPADFESTLKRKYKNINEILFSDSGEIKRIKKEGAQLKVYDRIIDLRHVEKKEPNVIARQLFADKFGVSIRMIDQWLSENNKMNKPPQNPRSQK